MNLEPVERKLEWDDVEGLPMCDCHATRLLSGLSLSYEEKI